MRCFKPSLLFVPVMLISAAPMARAGEYVFKNDSNGWVVVTVCAGKEEAYSAWIEPGKHKTIKYDGSSPEVLWIIWESVHVGGNSWTEPKVGRFTHHNTDFRKPVGHITDTLKMENQ